MEEEGDALGLRGLKTSMICYFLNRKQNRQDSKYAAALLLDLVLELGASDRTRARMGNTVVVNSSWSTQQLRGFKKQKKMNCQETHLIFYLQIHKVLMNKI